MLAQREGEKDRGRHARTQFSGALITGM
jgi:hypothetical protein